MSKNKSKFDSCKNWLKKSILNDTLKILILILLVIVIVAEIVMLFNDLYFITASTLFLFTGSFFFTYLKFKREMELFLYPSKEIMIKLFNMDENNKKIIIYVFNRNIDRLEKFGLLQLTTFMGVVIGGIRFCVFNYVRSSFVAYKLTPKNFPKLELSLNGDFLAASAIVVFLALIFYIYKVNFVNKSRIIIDEIKNETI